MFTSFSHFVQTLGIHFWLETFLLNWDCHPTFFFWFCIMIDVEQEAGQFSDNMGGTENDLNRMLSIEQVESINHWNGNVAMVTTLWLLASALTVTIEIRGAAGSPGWSRWLSFPFLKQSVPVAIYDTVFFHAIFIIHIYLCLQCFIPHSSSHIICYPFNANLLYIFNNYCVCPSFSGGLHATSLMTLVEVSQRAYDMIHFILGTYGYLYICEIYINLIWYLYLFMLNIFFLSLSLSLHILWAFLYGMKYNAIHNDINESTVLSLMEAPGAKALSSALLFRAMIV